MPVNTQHTDVYFNVDGEMQPCSGKITFHKDTMLYL